MMFSGQSMADPLAVKLLDGVCSETDPETFWLNVPTTL